MTDEEKTAMNELCRLIAVEKDPRRFHAFVVKLNDLLENKRTRLGQTPNAH
jgi:hypothetical protein